MVAEKKKPMGFFRYWGGIVRLTPGLLITGAVSPVAAIIMLVTLLLLLFNRPLARSIMNWDGISSWWALVPIGLLFLYGIMRAIHARHVELQHERNELADRLDQLRSESAIERVVSKMTQRRPTKLFRGKSLKGSILKNMSVSGFEEIFDIDEIENLDASGSVFRGPTVPQAPDKPQEKDPGGH
jgi:hypothetical protein